MRSDADKAALARVVLAFSDELPIGHRIGSPQNPLKRCAGRRRRSGMRLAEPGGTVADRRDEEPSGVTVQAGGAAMSNGGGGANENAVERQWMSFPGRTTRNDAAPHRTDQRFSVSSRDEAETLVDHVR